MPRSLLVVFLLLLVCSISGYAERQFQQSGLVRTLNGASQELFARPPTHAAQGSTPPPPGFSTGEPTLSREFDASHLVGLGNGKMVAIGAATWRLYSRGGNSSEFVDFILRDSSDDGFTWNVTHLLGSSVYRNEYASNPTWWLAEPLRAAFALVESNGASSEANRLRYYNLHSGPRSTIIRIVWMATLNRGFPKYSMSYLPMNVELPLMNGGTLIVGFLGNTSVPILTMKNKGLVFPVQLVTEHGSVTSAVLYRKSPNDAWKIGRVVPDLDTYNPAIVEWKDGELMMIAQHVDGYHRVYESTDFGNTWTESTGTLSRVWANSIPVPEHGSQSSLITATIDGKDVILFAQSVMTTRGNEFYLWLTSNTRIHFLGLIETGVTVKSSTLLFKGGKLYCLYEVVGWQGNRTVFKDLTAVIEDIKTVLGKWTLQDNVLSDRRCDAGETCTPPNCRIPTNGLVGYLSGKSTGDRWGDEYLSVDAVVSGLAVRVPDGLAFKGVGAGAMWPVITNAPVRPYHFANYAFTLAATVSIHEIPSGTASTPLLGVKLNDQRHSILLGVSYTSEGNWSTISKSGVNEVTDRKVKANKMYSVILTYGSGGGIVYIDGTRLSVPSGLPMGKSEEISHFYFGAYREGTQHRDIAFVTVTNVTLYNRVLTGEEITALSKCKGDISPAESDNKEPSKVEESIKFLETPRSVTSTSVNAVTAPSLSEKSPGAASESTPANKSNEGSTTHSSSENRSQEAGQVQSAVETGTSAVQQAPSVAVTETSKEKTVLPKAPVKEKEEKPAPLNTSIGEEQRATVTEGGDQTTLQSTSSAATTTPVPDTSEKEGPSKQDADSTKSSTAVNTPTISTSGAIPKSGPDVKHSRNKAIDGTVRVYGYGVPLLLLGLWAVATALP